MSSELKTTTAEVADALRVTTEVAREVVEASRERDTLRAEIEGLDAAVESAEQALADALAAVQLGERENADDASIKLAEARDAAKARPDLALRLRVAESVVVNLEARQRDAAARHAAAVEAAKAARIAVAEAKAQQAMDAARDGVAELRNRIAEAQAARRVLEGVGGRWMLGSIDIHEHSFTPDPAAVGLMVASLSREIAPA